MSEKHSTAEVNRTKLLVGLFHRVALVFGMLLVLQSQVYGIGGFSSYGIFADYPESQANLEGAGTIHVSGNIWAYESGSDPDDWGSGSILHFVLTTPLQTYTYQASPLIFDNYLIYGLGMVPPGHRFDVTGLGSNEAGTYRLNLTYDRTVLGGNYTGRVEYLTLTGNPGEPPCSFADSGQAGTGHIGVNEPWVALWQFTIPEPSTLGLLAAGTASLLFYAWRRKAKRCAA